MSPSFVFLLTSSMEPSLSALQEQLTRIEGKLDILIRALADEEDEVPGSTLDGTPVGQERDASQGLG